MTNTVLLRDVSEADLPIFFEQQLDPVATERAAFPSRDRATFMAHWAKIMADDSVTLKTVVCEGQVAGNIVCFGPPDQREVGYWLGREFWGRGIATQALSMLLNHVTARPLYAHVARHNLGSIRVLEKCGFTVIGMEMDLGDANGEAIAALILKLTA